ncbi:hypothetical protein BH20ACT5_BH20ACT5_21330 [soil metagenome]
MRGTATRIPCRGRHRRVGINRVDPRPAGHADPRDRAVRPQSESGHGGGGLGRRLRARCVAWTAAYFLLVSEGSQFSSVLLFPAAVTCVAPLFICYTAASGGPQLAAGPHGLWIRTRQWPVKAILLPWEAVASIQTRRNGAGRERPRPAGGTAPRDHAARRRPIARGDTRRAAALRRGTHLDRVSGLRLGDLRPVTCAGARVLDDCPAEVGEILDPRSTHWSREDSTQNSLPSGSASTVQLAASD